MARMIAVSDTLDAITTNEPPYRSAKEIDNAPQVIHNAAGSKFDLKVVEALEAVV